MLAAEADEKVCNIVHLIYTRPKLRRHCQGTTSSRAGPWRSTGPPVTRMSFGLFLTLKSCNVRTSWKVFAPSTGLTTDRNSMAAVFDFGHQRDAAPLAECLEIVSGIRIVAGLTLGLGATT